MLVLFSESVFSHTPHSFETDCRLTEVACSSESRALPAGSPTFTSHQARGGLQLQTQVQTVWQLINMMATDYRINMIRSVCQNNRPFLCYIPLELSAATVFR